MGRRMNEGAGVFAVVGVVVGAVGVARADLVVNGGFETGDFAGWTTQAAAAGSSFGVQFQGSGFAANFQGSAGLHDAIFQTLATQPGQQYTLDLAVLNYGVGEDSLQIVWEGAAVLDMTPVGTELESWVYLSLPLTATMAGSELKIRVHDGQSAVLIDSVSVNPVPAPGVLLAAAGAAGACATWGARRRRGVAGR